jgi:AraC family transcriptional regulator, melibiose operon regulatory protein
MSKTVPFEEKILTGKELGLSFIPRVASLHSRNASRITWHQHAAAECLFLNDGSTEYEFEDREPVSLSGGHFLVIPAKTKHRGLHNVRHPARLASIQVVWSKTSQNANSLLTTGEYRWLSDQFRHAQLGANPMNAELRRMIQALALRVRDFDSTQPEQTAGLRLLVCEILIETAKQLSTAKVLLTSDLVQSAMEYMHQHYASEPSIVHMTRALGVGRSRLFETFKSTTGLTPNDYLQRYRISKAVHLLKDSSLSITDIAMKCGFSTSQYFSYVFSKYQSMTPSAFRALET